MYNRLIIMVYLCSILLGQGFLRTDGPEIIDGNGDPILLRGFGLGGWLVPEGYMLHNKAWIDGFESPTQIENHIVDLRVNQGINGPCSLRIHLEIT